MWYIPLIVAAFVYIIFYILLVATYKRVYADSVTGRMNLNLAMSHAVFVPLLKFQPGFADIKANALLKLLIFLVFSVVIALTRWGIVLWLYTLLSFFAVKMMIDRRKSYRRSIASMDSETAQQFAKKAIGPSYRMYLLLGWYQLLLWALLYVVYGLAP